MGRPSTDEEAAAVHLGMWGSKLKVDDRGEEYLGSGGPTQDGEFWTFKLERVKDDPDQRYAVAAKALPIPAAWRECAIALRAKIRAKRKAKEDYALELNELHQLAAMHSFGYSHQRDGSNYDFFGQVPYARIAELDLSYDRLGCNQLSLLTATDQKWMLEKWGAAPQHTTASALYRDVYEKERVRVETADRQHEAKRRREFDQLIERELQRSEIMRSLPRAEPARIGGFVRMIKSIFGGRN